MSRAKKATASQASGIAINSLSEHRRETEVEAWICLKLRTQDLFGGTTTREIRRDRLVAHLEQRHLMDSHAGRIGGEAHTWRELVTKLYGEQRLSNNV